MKRSTNKKFECPRCEQHDWGTSETDGTMEVHCHSCGWIGLYDDYVYNTPFTLQGTSSTATVLPELLVADEISDKMQTLHWGKCRCKGCLRMMGQRTEEILQILKERGCRFE